MGIRTRTQFIFLSHFTKSKVGLRDCGDPARVALRAHSPVDVYPSWSRLQLSLAFTTSLHVLFFLWVLEHWQLESPVDCFVHGNPSLAVGVHRGNTAKASGPRKLSQTWHPTYRGAIFFSPYMESLSPQCHHFLYWFGSHLIYMAEINIF